MMFFVIYILIGVFSGIINSIFHGIVELEIEDYPFLSNICECAFVILLWPIVWIGIIVELIKYYKIKNKS